MERNKGLIPNNDAVKCTIKCDYCGATPARWFGMTSVAVCEKQGCINEASSGWDEHVRNIASEYDDLED